MDNDPEQRRLDLDTFIDMVNKFFLLWEEHDGFRSFIIVYLTTLKHIDVYAHSKDINKETQEKFKVLYSLLRDIELLPASVPIDPSYKDQLIQAKKLWQDLTKKYKPPQ